ncbi:hypothetical protein BpHYR1_042081 [Brachionus plicatilis]|uniref:Uncharacterized protein n=1 Tax=Brachionus plicatilis TaxID=10195 RepID=A0A3M7QW12_BRAPC|nr:hypothetical protein BpHYR1_042081 [Brachionus plicatilis]
MNNPEYYLNFIKPALKRLSSGSRFFNIINVEVSKQKEAPPILVCISFNMANGSSFLTAVRDSKPFFRRNLIIVYLLILTAWVLELKSVAISFRGLPERLRSEIVPVSSWQIDV